jgi:uncharacterized protein
MISAPVRPENDSTEQVMYLFFMAFFAIYGGVHVYFFCKARSAFAPEGAVSALLALVLVVLALAPGEVRIFEQRGEDAIARLVALVGYLWMGFLFFFFVTGILIDAYRVLLNLAGMFSRHLPFPLPSPGAAFFLPVAVSLLICTYAYFEAREIRTDSVTIPTAKLPPGTDRLRIVQLSDVHLGMMTRKERLQRMLVPVREAAPDLLVATGDLIDGEVADQPELAAILREIRPRLGKFAVTGNHEFYVGLRQTEQFARDAGFTLLRGEGQNVAGMLNIAGVDDPAGLRAGLTRPAVEPLLLKGLPADRFTLFLKHRPVVERTAAGLFDLQLSGHVHKGQLFPFNLITHLSYPVKMGLSTAGNGSLLYVSRGTGTWGPPFRFLAPPEVTVIDLVRTGR